MSKWKLKKVNQYDKFVNNKQNNGDDNNHLYERISV